MCSLMILLSPFMFVHAADGGLFSSGVVRCVGVSEKDSTDSSYNNKPVCNFRELVNTINFLINFMFFLVAPVVIALFSYAGFLMMTGKEENIKKGKDFFWRVVYGLSFMLGSAVIVKTVLYFLTQEKFNLTSLIQ